MLASLALVPAAIGVLAPAGPHDGCPSPRQVTDALASRLPGSVIPLGQALGASTLRLAVASDASGVTRLELSDAGGELLLRRALAANERGRAGDCLALAETVALIVERYWREVGYDVPPLPPARAPPAPPAASPPEPAPRVAEKAAPARAAEPEAESEPHPSGSASSPLWSFAASVTGRVGDTNAYDGASTLVAGMERGFGLRLEVGVATAASSASPVGRASFRRFPSRLGMYFPVHVRWGQLEPGFGVDLDAISVALDASTPTNLRSSALCYGLVCWSPGADVALGWAYRSRHHVFVRVLARAGISVPYRVTGTSMGAPEAEVWSAPRTYLGLAVESGLWFQ